MFIHPTLEEKLQDTITEAARSLSGRTPGDTEKMIQRLSAEVKELSTSLGRQREREADLDSLFHQLDPSLRGQLIAHMLLLRNAEVKRVQYRQFIEKLREIFLRQRQRDQQVLYPPLLTVGQNPDQPLQVAVFSMADLFPRDLVQFNLSPVYDSQDAVVDLPEVPTWIQIEMDKSEAEILLKLLDGCPASVQGSEEGVDIWIYNDPAMRGIFEAVCEGIVPAEYQGVFRPVSLEFNFQPLSPDPLLPYKRTSAMVTLLNDVRSDVAY